MKVDRVARLALLSGLFAALSFEGSLSAAPEAPAGGAAKTAVVQKSFKTAKDAAEALISACASYDVPALTTILGPDGADFIATKDEVQDKSRAAAFAQAALEKHSVVLDKKNASRATLLVGDEDWPLPAPLVKNKAGWHFDTKAGRQELLYRRIGGNELDAIQICEGYVEAQHEYASKKRDGSPVNQYAQRIISTPGKQDGLAWQNADGTWDGPVGENVAKAIAQGYSSKAKPYHGYYFKVLKGQGPAAPNGEMDFLVKGVMIGGFALVAAPADYRITGVKTFIVSHTGVVYEKDLGEKTLEAAKAMVVFNPDKTWKPVGEN